MSSDSERYLQMTDRLVRRFNGIHWMSSAGTWKPIDSGTIPVISYDEARRYYRDLVKLSNIVWLSQIEIARLSGRSQILEECQEYFTKYFNPDPDYIEWTTRKTADAVLSDLRGCIMEVVLRDIVSITFYRESLVWFERGHWRCGIDEHGRRLIW